MHFRITPILSTAVFWLLLWMPAASQADPCDDILDKGRTELDYQSDQEFSKALQTALTWSDEKLQQVVSSEKGEGGVSIGLAKLVLNLKGSGESAKNELAYVLSQLNSTQNLSEFWKNHASLRQRFLPPYIAEAWLKCKMRDKAVMLETDVKTLGPAESQFIVTFYYRPVAETDATDLEILSVSATHAAAVDMDPALHKGARIRRFSSVSEVFKRTSNEPVTIAVGMTGSSALQVTFDKFVPPVIAPPPPEVRPSIVKHVLLKELWTDSNVNKGEKSRTSGNWQLTVPVGIKKLYFEITEPEYRSMLFNIAEDVSFGDDITHMSGVGHGVTLPNTLPDGKDLYLCEPKFNKVGGGMLHILVYSEE